jgi:transcriptional regulator with XRE-family HTH domain
MTLSEFIKNYRKEHNLSQRKLAQKCGVSNGYISMIENEKNPCTGKEISLTIEKLKALADGMSVSLSYLLDVLDDMPVDISGEDSAGSNNGDIEDPDEKVFLDLYRSVPEENRKELLALIETALKMSGLKKKEDK